MKITQEIDRATLRLLLIAAWVAGWKSKADGYNIDHPSVKAEWDALQALVDTGGDLEKAEALLDRPAKKTEKRASSTPAGKKKPKACCGSKQQRHKKGCPKGDGNLPPDDVTWKCTECSEETTAAEKPEKCDCGAKTFIQK